MSKKREEAQDLSFQIENKMKKIKVTTGRVKSPKKLKGSHETSVTENEELTRQNMIRYGPSGGNNP